MNFDPDMVLPTGHSPSKWGASSASSGRNGRADFGGGGDGDDRLDNRADPARMRVLAEKEKLWARETARKELAEENREAEAAARVSKYRSPLTVSTWEQMQHPAKPPDPVISSPDGRHVVMRRGHTARVLADGKGGKTSLGLELLRSWLTGEKWLGYFDVDPLPAGSTVAFLDPELDADFPWYMQQVFGDLPREVVDRFIRVDLVEYKAEGFTWASETDRNWLARQLSGTSRVFVDSVLSLLPGGGGTGRAEASHSLDAVGEFLDQFQALRKMAGFTETLFGIHRPSGGAEKSFGSIQWDAKFQALWSIKVDEDSGVRRLRGYAGRAGTGFPERELVRTDRGRIQYRGPAAVPDAGDMNLADAAAVQARREAEKAQREREAIETALEYFPGVLAELADGMADGAAPPSKEKVWLRLVEVVKSEGGTLSRRRYVALWDEVERRGLAHIRSAQGGLAAGVIPIG